MVLLCEWRVRTHFKWIFYFTNFTFLLYGKRAYIRKFYLKPGFPIGQLFPVFPDKKLYVLRLEKFRNL